MRRQYLIPEIELIQFNYKDIVAATGNSEVQQPIKNSLGVFQFNTIQNQSDNEVTPDAEIVWGETTAAGE